MYTDTYKNGANGAGHSVVALLTGLGVGLGVGLLFAPKTGRQTRAGIANSLNCGIEEAKKKTTELHTAATETLESGKRALEDQARGIRHAVEAGKRAYHDTTAV